MRLVRSGFVYTAFSRPYSPDSASEFCIYQKGMVSSSKTVLVVQGCVINLYPWRHPMNQFLTRILDAHGGLYRWNGYEKVDAKIVSGGGLFALKGVLPDLNPRRM